MLGFTDGSDAMIKTPGHQFSKAAHKSHGTKNPTALSLTTKIKYL